MKKGAETGWGHEIDIGAETGWGEGWMDSSWKKGWRLGGAMECIGVPGWSLRGSQSCQFCPRESRCRWKVIQSTHSSAFSDPVAKIFCVFLPSYLDRLCHILCPNQKLAWMD